MAEIARQIGVSGKSLREWCDRGVDINCAALAKMAEAGLDVAYILTGKKVASAKEPEPLAPPIEPPASCPNGGLCRRLSMLVQLQKVLLSGELHGDLVDVAIRAVAAYRAKRVRPPEGMASDALSKVPENMG